MKIVEAVSKLVSPLPLFDCFPNPTAREVKMKFQYFEIAEIWLLEMKFEMGLEIVK